MIMMVFIKSVILVDASIAYQKELNNNGCKC